MLVYRSGSALGNQLVTVQWLDGEGKAEPLLARPGNYFSPRLSPDGQRLALEIADGAKRDVWISDWHRETAPDFRHLLRAGGMFPTWSPDGRYIVFSTGLGGLFWTQSDGAGKPQPLTQTNKTQQAPWSFGLDGKRLWWTEPKANGLLAVWTMPLESDGTGLRGGKPQMFLQDSFDERHAVLSPDGRWLAYTSNESGNYQVYVRAFPDRGGKWQISNGSGASPFWSHNGRDLFFGSLDNNRIMVATYTTKGDSFLADQPRVWSM